MSAEINNREYRQQVLQKLISQLHGGKSVEEVKNRFTAVFGDVSAEEIAQAEQILIDGGLSVSQVQRLCDVHAPVFQKPFDCSECTSDATQTPGHPANILWRENRAIEQHTDLLREKLSLLPDDGEEIALKIGLKRLMEIDRHYSKKEKLLFPYLEQYGTTVPLKVMWGVDDEIRAQLKEILKQLETQTAEQMESQIEALFDKIKEMIWKEENTLLPVLLEKLTQGEWKTVADKSREIGYCLIGNVPEWQPPAETRTHAAR